MPKFFLDGRASLRMAELADSLSDLIVGAAADPRGDRHFESVREAPCRDQLLASPCHNAVRRVKRPSASPRPK
jgi:hypothetical protein